MKILRVILSIIVLGVGVYLAVQDFSKKEFFEYTIRLNDINDKKETFEVWKHKQDILTWLEKQFSLNGIKAKKILESFHVQMELKDEEQLKSIIDSGNHKLQLLFDEQQLQIQKKTQKTQQKELQLKEKISNLQNLLDQLSVSTTFEGMDVEDTSNKENDVDKSEVTDSKIIQEDNDVAKDSTISEHKNDEEAINNLIEDEIEIEVTENYQQLKEEMKQLNLSLKTEIVEDLKSLEERLLKQQKTSEKMVQESFLDHREQSHKQIDALFKRMSTMLKGYQTHTGQLMTRQKHFLLQYFSVQLERLKHEKENLVSKVNVIKRFSIQLESSKLKPEIAHMSASFKHFILAALACFIFNFLWEMIAQRKK